MVLDCFNDYSDTAAALRILIVGVIGLIDFSVERSLLEREKGLRADPRKLVNTMKRRLASRPVLQYDWGSAIQHKKAEWSEVSL